MKNIVKVAFLSSVITAAIVYVLVEWRPLQSAEAPPTPEVSWASSIPASNEPANAAAPLAVGDDESNNIDIYQRFSPGVVNISTTALAYDFFLRPIPTAGGTGSGAIIDKEGHIVTNFHVIQGADSLEVTLADKSKHPATVVGADAGNDLAVIKINVPADRLSTIPLGTSQNLQVGQKVLAIGNPFGFLDRTLTTGIISSLGRAIQATDGRIIENIIQTDAAINSGNSGGPLLNSNGEIVGINTAIIAGSTGIGFAIPADTVKRVATDLITLGYVRRPFFGISQQSVLELNQYGNLAEVLGLETEGGLMVMQVAPGSPAAQGGIRGASRAVNIGNTRLPVGGDVILSFAGRTVNSFQELLAAIDRQKPGDRVVVTVLRNNQRVDVPVVLAELPRNQ